MIRYNFMEIGKWALWSTLETHHDDDGGSKKYEIELVLLNKLI